MRVFAMLALALSSLLASASAQAHSRPTSLTKHEALTAPVHVYVAAFGPGRLSVSVHTTPSFHSTPAYHSFAPAPSRSFTFSARPTVTASPSISTRPVATYSRPATVSHYSVDTPPPVIHHYPPPVVSHYESRTGGMSMTEALLLHQALSSSNTSAGNPAPSYAPSSSTPLPIATRQLGPAEQEDEGWAVASFIGLGLLIIVGGGLLLHLATRKEAPNRTERSSGYQSFS